MSGDYDIGYKKPPKDTQFKKGRSGNPNGRPRGTKNVVRLLNRMLDETIVVSNGGRKYKITRREGVLLRMIDDALKGCPRARQQILSMAQTFDEPEPFRADESDQEAFKIAMNDFVKSLERQDAEADHGCIQ